MNFTKAGAYAVAGTLSATLLISACSSGSVSGPVQSKQVDTCETLSMEPMASVVVTKGKPGGGGSKSSSSGGGSGKTTKKVDTNKPSKTNGSTGGSGKTGDSGKKSKKPKTCSTEYELMVTDKEDGVIEQDVTSEEYARCDVGEQYPACKEN
jgi:hypothetical protein